MLSVHKYNNETLNFLATLIKLYSYLYQFVILYFIIFGLYIVKDENNY